MLACGRNADPKSIKVITKLYGYGVDRHTFYDGIVLTCKNKNEVVAIDLLKRNHANIDIHYGNDIIMRSAMEYGCDNIIYYLNKRFAFDKLQLALFTKDSFVCI